MDFDTAAELFGIFSIMVWVGIIALIIHLVKSTRISTGNGLGISPNLHDSTYINYDGIFSQIDKFIHKGCNMIVIYQKDAAYINELAIELKFDNGATNYIDNCGVLDMDGKLYDYNIPLMITNAIASRYNGRWVMQKYKYHLRKRYYIIVGNDRDRRYDQKMKELMNTKLQ